MQLAISFVFDKEINKNLDFNLKITVPYPCDFSANKTIHSSHQVRSATVKELDERLRSALLEKLRKIPNVNVISIENVINPEIMSKFESKINEV